MTAKNVTNNHVGPLRVGGVLINAGATARVDNWQNVERSSVVAQWADQEILTVEDAPDAPAFPPAKPSGFPPAAKSKGFAGKDLSNDPEGAEKDALIARLKELTGAEKTRASSVESLKRQIAEAEAKQQA